MLFYFSLICNSCRLNHANEVMDLVPLAQRRPEVACHARHPCVHLHTQSSAFQLMRFKIHGSRVSILLAAGRSTGECGGSFSKKRALQGAGRYEKSQFSELGVGGTRAACASMVDSYCADRRFFTYSHRTAVVGGDAAALAA